MAFDGSEPAFWALDRAIKIAKRDKASITVYHAIKHHFRFFQAALFPFFSSEDVFTLPTDIEDKVYQNQLEIAKRVLQEAGKRLEGTGIEHDLELVENLDPVTAAKELVSSKNIDLVIVGARGLHGALEKLFLGTVCTGIVNKIQDTDVLVVKTPP